MKDAPLVSTRHNPEVNAIIHGLMVDGLHDWGCTQPREGHSSELGRHTEQLFREQHVALLGMEKWYSRYEWVERQIARGIMTVADTWGMEPLQSNWDTVCHMLALYSPIDSDLQLADSVTRSLALTKEKRTDISRKLRVRQRQIKSGKLKEIHEQLDLTPEEEQEVKAWAVAQLTKRGYVSRRLYLDNGKSLASRSAAVRHAERRERQREKLAKKNPLLTLEQIEKYIDPRGKGYGVLDAEILRKHRATQTT